MFNLDCVTHVCVCGSQMWQLDWVIFDDYEIAAYSLDMTCKLCGAQAKAPTLPDKPEESGFVSV
jgi:hypothetical protein